MKKWIRPFGLLLLLIILCSVIARVISRSESLLEYAEKYPEIAYATPKATANQETATEQTTSPEAEAGQVTEPAQEAETEQTSAPAQEAAPEASPVLEAEAADSVHYQDGFFYQPLSDTVKARITGISYPVSESVAPLLSLQAVNVIPDEESPAVSYDDLRYMNVLYYDFNKEVQTGELICNKGIADDLVEIFYELYQNEYQIEKIRLIDEYGGDDTASMEDNNTSCFNYRAVDGTSRLSKHALGCAIDINPFYNPYIVFDKTGNGSDYISPKGSESYADRSLNFPYKIDENDLCYKLFKEHGFVWGGDWNSCKDYQHFQKAV